jgi:hypothetical protein
MSTDLAPYPPADLAGGPKHRSLYARPLITRGKERKGKERRAVHRRCPSQAVRAADTMAPVFVPRRSRRGPLPEICQKLRHT